MCSSDLVSSAPFVSLSLSEVLAISQPQGMHASAKIFDAAQPKATPTESVTPDAAQSAISTSENESPSQSETAPAESQVPVQSTTVPSDAQPFETDEAFASSRSPHDVGGPREDTPPSSSLNDRPSADQCPVLDDESDPITRVIRTLGLDDVSARHARPRANDARTTHLPQSAPH